MMWDKFDNAKKSLRTSSTDKLKFKRTEDPSPESGQNTTEDPDSRFKAIFEYSPTAIMYTNADGTITTANDKATRLFGAPKEKLIGFSYQSIRNDSMRNAIADALSGQKTYFEGEYLTVTGNVLTNMRAKFSPAYHSNGLVSGVIGIFEDVTGRMLVEKKREARIRELQSALAKTRQPGGFLPICSLCKKIRDNQGHWNPFETHFNCYYQINFTHGVCPECAQILYDDIERGSK